MYGVKLEENLEAMVHIEEEFIFPDFMVSSLGTSRVRLLTFLYRLTHFSQREQELINSLVVWAERVVLSLLSLSLQICLRKNYWFLSFMWQAWWSRLFLSEVSGKRVLGSHVTRPKAGGFFISDFCVCFSLSAEGYCLFGPFKIRQLKKVTCYLVT